MDQLIDFANFLTNFVKLCATDTRKLYYTPLSERPGFNASHGVKL